MTETRCEWLISCQCFLCLVFSDITLRYKETRRRKQEVPGDRPLGNGNGNTVTPSGRSKLNGSLETVRQRKSWERPWVLTGLSAAECKVWWENGKTHEATHVHGFVPTWMKWVIEKRRGRQLFSCGALSCDYYRKLTCSIHVEHETFWVYFTALRLVFKKKKAQPIEKYYTGENKWPGIKTWKMFDSLWEN